MASAFQPSTRSSVSRQVRGDGALNTIMEDIQELAIEYSHSHAQRVAPQTQQWWHEYDGRNQNFNPRRGRYAAGSGSRTPSPLSQDERANDQIRISISSKRASCSTDCHGRQLDDFDDLYDVTDDSDRESCPSLSSQGDTRSSGSFTVSDISASPPKDTRRRTFPTLYIPSSNFLPTMKNSPVPPTPPPKIPVTPRVLAKLPRNVPALAAPPSLAGSVSAGSDRPSTFSTPQTPDLADLPNVVWSEQQLRVRDEADAENISDCSSDLMSPQVDVQLESPQDWDVVLGYFPPIPQNSNRRSSSDCDSVNPPSVESSNKGVRLPSRALSTLQRFDVKSDRSLSSQASEPDENVEMHEISGFIRPKSTGDVLNASPYSGSSFTSLSLPSPGGFFASLKGQARKTWCLPSVQTPTSAMAERFYHSPLNPSQDKILEQVIECKDDITEGPPTAKALASAPLTARKVPAESTPRFGHEQTSDEDDTSEYDASYAQNLKARAESNFDRTTFWLATQTFTPGIGDPNALSSAQQSPKITPVDAAENNPLSPGPKKSVQFAGTVFDKSPKPPATPSRCRESVFYLGFQHVRRNSQQSDIFLQSNFRFEAVQANRLSSPTKHINLLDGKFELSTPVRPPYRGPFSQAPRNSKLPEILQEMAMFLNVAKEQDVLSQLHESTWAMDALKFLNGGPLIPSPAAKRLADAAPSSHAIGKRKRRVRVLDIAGHTACEWAWHVASEYPSVRVYTAVTKQQTVSPLDGPPNHKHVRVNHLWRLPFKDNQFDLISARSLHIFLKSSRPVGTELTVNDEFDMCLKECFRCLKPGGYLEFFLMDSEIVRAGMYGSATSVEFGFNLKTRGYDPAPTKAFLSRLRKARFEDIKRAWLFLPMGAPYNDDTQVPGSKPSEATSPEDMLYGSTVDVASTTGLLGGWMWEQWMLKLQTEMGRESNKLVEETAAVIDEGRKCGAGWRCLSGWAMKPKKKRESSISSLY